ncbi:MAG: HD domain-containing phosphohydrolase [Gemmatimonadota bacterium]
MTPESSSSAGTDAMPGLGFARHAAPAHRFTILVADDDELARTLHAEFVRGFGYDVEVAADGIEALAKVALGVDLVLTDAHMPNMDGFDVARRIRETRSPQDLPIVMVTSLEAREDRLRAYQAGINDFINKPVDHVELRLRLHWLLELKAAQDQLLASQATLEATVERRTRELRSALEDVTAAQRRIQEGHLDTIYRLTLAAEYKDHDTAGHIERIGRYSEVMARAMHLAPGLIDTIRHAAPMHDVGKLGIPDHILLKPGPLTDEERGIMNTHTSIGGQILAGSTSPVIQMGQRIAMAHHEKWDGTGYPNGISGDEIPVEARICTVVDFFDALTFDRPYRKAVPNEEVREMMREESSTRFDADVLDVFFSIQDEVEAIQADASGH